MPCHVIPGVSDARRGVCLQQVTYKESLQQAISALPVSGMLHGSAQGLHKAMLSRLVTGMSSKALQARKSPSCCKAYRRVAKPTLMLAGTKLC